LGFALRTSILCARDQALFGLFVIGLTKEGGAKVVSKNVNAPFVNVDRAMRQGLCAAGVVYTDGWLAIAPRGGR
jgi:hypothetical protein